MIREGENYFSRFSAITRKNRKMRLKSLSWFMKIEPSENLSPLSNPDLDSDASSPVRGRDPVPTRPTGRRAAPPAERVSRRIRPGRPSGPPVPYYGGSARESVKLGLRNPRSAPGSIEMSWGRQARLKPVPPGLPKLRSGQWPEIAAAGASRSASLLSAVRREAPAPPRPIGRRGKDKANPGSTRIAGTGELVPTRGGRF